MTGQIAAATEKQTSVADERMEEEPSAEVTNSMPATTTTAPEATAVTDQSSTATAIEGELAAGFVVRVAAELLQEYLASKRELPDLIPAVETNGCELLMQCIGKEGFAPNRDCPWCAGIDAVSGLDVKLDAPLGSDECWPGLVKKTGGAGWFAKRLPHAYGIISVYISTAYQKWREVDYTDRLRVTGHGVYNALLEGLGTGWLDAWGSKITGPQHLAELIVHWLADEIVVVQTTANSGKTAKRQNIVCLKETDVQKKHTKYEAMLKKLGGIPAHTVFHIGQKIEGRWLDEYGGIDLESVEWVPGAIKGPGVEGHAGTWHIAFDDGREHFFTPSDKIRVVDVARGHHVIKCHYLSNLSNFRPNTTSRDL
jgi:hypothetical protein